MIGECWVIDFDLSLDRRGRVRRLLVLVSLVIGMPRSTMFPFVSRNELRDKLCMVSVLMRHYQRLGFLVVML
jgi:hypothetical protein